MIIDIAMPSLNGIDAAYQMIKQSALEAVSRGRHFFSGAIDEVLLEDYMRQLKQKGRLHA